MFMSMLSSCWNLDICVAITDVYFPLKKPNVYFSEWRFTLLYICRLLCICEAVYFALLNIYCCSQACHLLHPTECIAFFRIMFTTGVAKRPYLPSIFISMLPDGRPEQRPWVLDRGNVVHASLFLSISIHWVPRLGECQQSMLALRVDLRIDYFISSPDLH
jgi:hypothetical protein